MSIKFLYSIILVSIVAYCCGVHIGVSVDSPWWHSLVYQFCHVNVFHLVCCCVCLYSVIDSGFIVRAKDIATAYAISCVATFPGDVPTEGMSGFLYALYALMSWQVYNKRRYHTIVAISIATGMLFPSINVACHAVSYMTGLIVCQARIWYAGRG